MTSVSKQIVWLLSEWSNKAVLLNLFRFRSLLPSIAAFPFSLLWMCGRCDNNHNIVARMLIVRPRYLIYSQHAFRRAANWLRSSNLVWLQTQLRKMFFCLISTRAIWTKERRSSLVEESFATDEWREFYCLHIPAVVWKKNKGAEGPVWETLS